LQTEGAAERNGCRNRVLNSGNKAQASMLNTWEVGLRRARVKTKSGKVL